MSVNRMPIADCNTSVVLTPSPFGERSAVLVTGRPSAAS